MVEESVHARASFYEPPFATRTTAPVTVGIARGAAYSVTLCILVARCVSNLTIIIPHTTVISKISGRISQVFHNPPPIPPEWRLLLPRVEHSLIRHDSYTRPSISRTQTQVALLIILNKQLPHCL